jgi:hypothetical protein
MLNALHNAFPINGNHMEARSRLDADETGHSIALPERLDQLMEVYVTESVSIVGKKDLFIAQVLLDSFQSHPDVRAETGV